MVSFVVAPRGHKPLGTFRQSARCSQPAVQYLVQAVQVSRTRCVSPMQAMRRPLFPVVVDPPRTTPYS